MADIATTWGGQAGEWAVEAGELARDAGLRSAVILSLFCDRRAEDGDPLPPGEVDPRGWWGEAFADVGASPLGSRLWLLRREKQTETTRSRAERYAREALAWLVEDGVAASVEVSARWAARGRLEIDVMISRPERGDDQAFSLLWDQEGPNRGA